MPGAAAGEPLRVSDEEGLVLQLSSGSEYRLPPDLSALQPAPPGQYLEHSSGVTVSDPDFLALWEIRQSRDNPDKASWEKGPTVQFPPRG
jgi:hypothetical protein